MNIETIVVGNLETNCYLIEKNNKVIVVDPGDDFEKIDKEIEGKEVVGIFITHYHFDHIGALEDIQNKYRVEVNPSKLNGFNYEIIKTPGHKPDCLTFYFKEEKLMFTGDFIFYQDIGATHFPGGNFNTIKESLKLISSYPNDIICYPGHGSKTILGDEKEEFKKYL